MPLQVEANNYEAAWDTLDQTFDNQRAIIENNISEIRNLPVMQKDADSILLFRQTVKTLEVSHPENSRKGYRPDPGAEYNTLGLENGKDRGNTSINDRRIASSYGSDWK